MIELYPYVQREADTMSLADHKNVVKLLGFEKIEELAVTKRVIAMEYCTEGCLQQLIDSNPNGISSDEFYTLGGHVVSAMQHLNEINIVHRDIKPANIMISKIDGHSVYKIGDFGAARILQSNQTYGSLYGTYEYMHPDIFTLFHYQNLDIYPTVKRFNQNYEHWSVGATFYEALTGQLPFRPKQGRDDKTMFKMISGKKIGQISAVEKDNGIEWASELPETCSVENKKKVTALLAGLLKVSNFYHLWSKCKTHGIFCFILILFANILGIKYVVI